MPTGCDSSEYGCCSDGFSYAKGPNKEGCAEENVDLSNDCSCNSCSCVCCDCLKSSILCDKRNCELNTEFHMSPFSPYVACIYPPKRAASVVPTTFTNNNLNPNKCGTNPNNCINYNFPGSSADICTYNAKTGCARLGIGLYKAGVPQQNCKNPLERIVPEPPFGMMNSMPSACMKQCNKGIGCGERGNVDCKKC